ncbi:hypothetical protein Goe16_01980 [Bacillus phage vB_BsuM-Goe16]|nr:hypothetical protein Goe16_00040 [Bacillus phage vB_BsuM-Goe16]WCS68612.1 hypothetical protein Goe16_01980 [Bacillus phage vB_BsuM-Goe16]
MQMYKLTAGTTGYYTLLTRTQAEHMLALWGDKYSIDDCTPSNPIYSPSKYTKLELVYMAANATA